MKCLTEFTYSTYIDHELSAEEIRAAIREAAERGGLKFVVLVGDALPRLSFDAELRICLPSGIW